MESILLTNDDGVDSPALIPLARELAALAPVRTVVPHQERSWISKAISRWDELRVDRVERDGFEIFVVRGFPADCTNLGVYSLFEGAPGLVVSGVNIGLNAGLGFFLSSGTVGAVTEGWIAGVPGIAFSIGSWGKDRQWKQQIERLSAETWERAAALSADVVRSVQEVGFPDGADLLNVNFPLGAGPETPRVVTRIAAVGYDRLFRRKTDGVYVYDYSGGLQREDHLDGTDVQALQSGCVSITPVCLAHTAELTESTRRGLERRT